MTCSKIENWIESDKGSLVDLPQELEQHAKNCQSCGNYLKAARNISASFSAIDLSAKDIAKIKSSVLNQVGTIAAGSATTSVATSAKAASLVTSKVIVPAIVAASILGYGIFKIASSEKPVKKVDKAIKTISHEATSSFFVTGTNASVNDSTTGFEVKVWLTE
jgi:hypothetical protein